MVTSEKLSPKWACGCTFEIIGRMLAHMSAVLHNSSSDFDPQSREISASAAMQLLEVGRRHYVEDESLSSIAQGLGLSRFKIARMAREARERGLVKISLQVPDLVDLEASQMVRRAWPALRECIVVPTPPSDGPLTVRGAIASAAADLLMERVTVDDVFGLACGRTVNEAAARISRLPACTIVQLTGVTSQDAVGDSSIRSMQRVAALSRGRSFPIYAPVVLESPEVVQALSREPGIAAAKSRLNQLTVALVTVGAWREGESTLYSACPPALRSHVSAEGAVAELAGHLLNADGQVVGRGFTERCLVAPLAAIQGARLSVLAAAGRGRVAAIAAVLNAGVVTSLVTDADTAALLITQPRGK